MTTLSNHKRRSAVTFLLLIVSSFALSACSAGHSEVSGWWYHQEYQVVDAGS